MSLFGKVKELAGRIRDAGLIGAFSRQEPNLGLLDTKTDEPQVIPRGHHYRYAHMELPRLIFEDPAAFLELLDSPMAEAWLLHAWENVGDAVRAESGAEKLEPTGLGITTCEIDSRRCCIITLPAPHETIECFFSAVVPDSMGKTCRYFVLERTQELPGEAPIGKLCEWMQDGNRTNHDRWAAGTRESFL